MSIRSLLLLAHLLDRAIQESGTFTSIEREHLKLAFDAVKSASHYQE